MLVLRCSYSELECVYGTGEVDSDSVGGHHEEGGRFVEELRESEIANPLFYECLCADEFETLHLSEVCVLSHHVDEEEFGDVPEPETLLVLVEGLPDECHFLLSFGPLLSLRLAIPDLSDEVAQSDHYLNMIFREYN